MTTTRNAPTAQAARRGNGLAGWDPENRDFWQRTGARVARRNLIFSVLSEHIGFSVWSLWSVLVLFLTPAYGISADPKTAAAEKFLLTTVPTVVGAVLRIPYTLAVARFGGRTWTVISAVLLLAPTVAIAVVLVPGVSYGTLLLTAAIAGVGGGNFASSMANINAFYPQRLKGRALGLNAGGGNIGVAVVQLAGLAVLATAGKDHPRVLVGVYIPLIVAAALCSALFMDNLPGVRNDRRAMRQAAKNAHTWIIAALYIATFGSFIGFSFAFGQVLQVQFAGHFLTAGKADPVKIASLTFLGPLVGSAARPAGGWLADRFGGARATFWNFALMALAGAAVLAASVQRSLPLFCAGFIALFALSGLGNGSTYKMIPAVLPSRAMAGATIGIAGAVGALGGALVNLAFRQSFLSYGTGTPAYLGFIASYLLCMAVTWAVYLRPHGTAASTQGRNERMSIYDSIGGASAVGAAVDDFYARVLADPGLAPFFAGTDLDRLKAHQRSFIAAAIGGPEIFAGRDMASAHAGLAIRDADFDAVVAHLVDTLTGLGVPGETIGQIGAALAPLRADVVSAQEMAG